ncbi:MAG: autoinducer synthase [Roseovarius sp.]|nr:autoinducer synthase [Roseovarius sp.]MBK45366.1 autoinducer synthase [Roseovarius sp.]|tara:strand:- start:800 stop:1597 length:798 start_codon:yes stop_codon:yes gene_type:complete
MILVIDAINKDRFASVLDEMFKLRARVFGDRLGWQVNVVDGRERDVFDDLDPAYAVGLDDDGNVVSCVRALQTTGPHMLSDVFYAILDGEPPLRSPHLWESTRFCVDTQRLGRGRGPNSVSYATCELMIASLEAAKRAGVSDIVTVIDPVMDRVLKRSGNAPYDYVGRQAEMGKVPALAALLDCTDERIARIRKFSGIEGDVFLSEEEALCLLARRAVRAPAKSALEIYCDEQVAAATTTQERVAALRLRAALADRVRSRSDISA